MSYYVILCSSVGFGSDETDEDAADDASPGLVVQTEHSFQDIRHTNCISNRCFLCWRPLSIGFVS
jgi:hypothetical protein